jgi:hypothetical protein
MVQIVEAMDLTEMPLIVGNRPCSRCPKLEHSTCIGCQAVYCRSHAMSHLSWSSINYGYAKLPLVLCQSCLAHTINILNTAQINLRLLAEYDA